MKSSVLLERQGGPEANNYGATKMHPDFVGDYCDDRSRHGSMSLGRMAELLPQKAAEVADTRRERWAKKFLWILPLVHSEFWIAAGFSLLQSFYPAMALDKGLNADEFSYVYSAYKVAMMFGAIMAERIMVWCSPVACYLLGMTGCFAFNLLFGEEKAKFGLQYLQKWGYPAPFFVIGIIIILAFPAIVSLKSVLNKDYGSFAQAHDPKEVTINYSKLLWDPMFIAGLGCMVLCWGQMGFNEPTLEPSLEEFELSSTQIGTVYTIQFGSSAVGSIVAAVFAHFKVPVMFAVWVSKAFCSFRTAKLSLTDPKTQCSNENNSCASKN
ncbi:hypothetical protein HPB50_016862 [Hyalomma asiaticum]|uniref:Uncharacterized protein n=1 Tax=Hyalomma asiaticum TaxID=266040 RepID=A0ACB7S1C4_HYAAI|nr:hypothetical protein HPB50_016862 [Hyalomma asiaticum]